jgi:DNA excision repair protein ERCC-2
MKKINLAVRDFALPIPRAGHIEVHSGYTLLSSGQEVHDAVQKEKQAQHPLYKAEVKLSHSFERAGFKFVVSGRLDGLYDTDPPMIEEIKSAFSVPELRSRLETQLDHPYILQLKTYAYIYTITYAVRPTIRLHLASSSGSGYAEDMPISFDIEEYEKWLEKRLEELVAEAQFREEIDARRRTAGDTLTFPFAKPRTGQTELIHSIEKGLEQKLPLMIQAPTGLGKTAGVLFPVLKDSLKRGQKVVYVTPKNSQHSVAEDAIERFQAEGSDIQCMTLTAKSKLCMKPEPVCNPDYCEYARDFYGKLGKHDLVNTIAKNEKNVDADTFKRYGEQYQVCPFELSVECIEKADVVIGDYNYVFSPRSLIGRLTSTTWTKGARPNLIIDEAHNLPSRTTDYYSPVLSAGALSQTRDRLRQLPGSYAIEAESLLNKCLTIIAKQTPPGDLKEAEIKIDPKPFVEHDKKLREFLSRYLQSNLEIQQKDPVMQLCHGWSDFTEALGNLNEQYFTTYRRTYDGGILKITCCDASDKLKSAYDVFENVLAFSATLKPFEYYAKLSGFPETVSHLEFQSPFPTDNRKLLVIPQVSTKYSDRQKNYHKIADAITRMVTVKPGNYFVFFPSFEFLEAVRDRVSLIGFNILSQQREMSAKDIESWLNTLRAGESHNILFAVQGGVFSEGVDYPGDMIIGAFIVGPALPKFDLERELLRAYYEKNYSSGFDYAYTYPAMTRVVQAAGRVIRSEEDRGLIVLMDQRFTANAYTKSMPGDWFNSSVKELVSNKILQDISDFWNAGTKENAG